MTRRRILLTLFCIAVLAGVAWFFVRPHSAELSVEAVTGPNPELASPTEEVLPMMNVARAVGWPEGAMPAPAQGLEVNAFARGLAHPRWMLLLPNGDVLVAETGAPPGESSGGIRGWIEERLMKRAGAATPSANRIRLLRDSDSDGIADQQSILLDASNGLNSPFGMALIDGHLYVANTDAILRFTFRPGQTRIEGRGEKIIDLPAQAPNGHWTRALAAHPDDPNLLYVSVGSNSNVGENGMESEENRAAVLEVNLADRDFRIYTAGMRNPVGLDFEPDSGRLYAVVNERDMLGGDLVPDYLTEATFGGHYGWPSIYWGDRLDDRVPATPRMIEYTAIPEYALGPHVAALGLEFSERARLGGAFVSGAFVGLHGSWNRRPHSGYKVVFVPFADGHPRGGMIDILTGFLNEDGEAMGRPVGVITDRTGALLVADDVGNRIWRVSNPRARRRARAEG
ncbi:MAG: sorbosone dehydrogenase family protein [Sphingomonadaceae bacterium]|nr:sorbosone dehydrogenase family protein [Sphingomonadaceae bacterium]